MTPDVALILTATNSFQYVCHAGYAEASKKISIFLKYSYYKGDSCHRLCGRHTITLRESQPSQNISSSLPPLSKVTQTGTSPVPLGRSRRGAVVKRPGGSAPHLKRRLDPSSFSR